LYAVTTSGTTQYTVFIENATSTAVLASQHTSTITAVPTVNNATAACVVVLAASTVIKFRAQGNTAGRIVRYQTFPTNFSNATGMVAVRIA
jgi:hypothetical protein